jgi:phosphatidate cytidylyltransferase
LALLLVIVGCLMVSSRLPFFIFLSLMFFAAQWEWLRLLKASTVAQGSAAILMLGALIWLYHLPAQYTSFWQRLPLIATLVWLVLVPFFLYTKKRIHPVLSVPFVLLLLLAALYSAWRLFQIDRQALFALALLVWIADIAAYFAGKAFGTRKLAPTISPSKTWQGVYGAAAGVLVFALALAHHTQREWLALTIACLVLMAYAIIGDLYESLLKRQAEVKDSSQLLPGHGGVFDRIDALLPVLPMGYLIISWWP